MTLRLSMTAVMPGADQAAATAASRSDHERTVPVRGAVPLEITTVRLFAEPGR